MKRLSLCTLFLLVAGYSVANASITSVTLTPLSSPTTMSDGRPYYLAGKSYSFRVQAVDPSGTLMSSWQTITLSFGGTASVVYPIGGSAVMVGVGNGIFTDNASTVTNLDYTIKITFLWNCVPLASTVVSPTIVATVANSLGFPGTDTRNILYGIASDIRVENFAQNGVAADGYVNPYHSAFNVTGAIVYDLPGSTSTLADQVSSYADLGSGEITGLTLLRNGTASGCTLTSGDESGFTFAVPVTYFSAFPLGTYSWTVQCVTATAPLSETSVVANALSITSDKVRIDTISITGGGGVDVPNFYRSALVSGTKLSLTASLESGTAGVNPMIGATTVTVSYGPVGFAVASASGSFTVNIPGGQFSTVAEPDITLPLTGITPDQGTTPIEYRVTKISGSVFDAEQDLLINPASITITPPVSPDRTIYWDRNDTPNEPFTHAAGVFSTPFTLFASPVSTAGSITFFWTPLSFCPDFYTYRIYYKKTVDSTWTVVDRTTTGYGPLETYDMSVVGTSTAAISGLLPLTSYDYQLSAVDLFGQEVPVARRATGVIATAASSITVSVSDGVTTFNDDSFFTDPLSTARVLRQTAIKVTFVVITSGWTPDQINIILAADVLNPSPANEESTPLINIGTNPWSVTGTEGTDYYRIACSKTGPNTYSGYIPATNPLIATMGQSCRFVVEMYRGSGVSYADNDSESETATSPKPNDDPWTFQIQTATTFTPWPIRILNNVITSSHPIAYPSYYLTEDGYVTITVTDVMGLPVATLLDSAFRKGGQNIKENGWNGHNMAGNKCGTGLYYVRVKAKSAATGKVILNEVKKIEMAK